MVAQLDLRQGEVYWGDLDRPFGSEPGYRRPLVVVQSDPFNRSGIRTVVVCPLTSNTRRAQSPGTVQLREGEAGLADPSVVNVSQILTVDRGALDEYLGTLSRRRVLQIVAGIHLLIDPSTPD